MNQIENKRLTWDTLDPAPFESGWSIFLKVMCKNYLSVYELMKLIKKNDFSSQGIYVLNLGDSSWIDFDKFGQLLNINPDRLKTGFLDNLGFLSLTNKLKRYKVRHCPVCIKHGYHCALFDLALINECPWHHVSLIDACAGCVTPRTMGGDLSLLDNKAKICSQCEMTLREFLTLVNSNRFDLNMSATVLGYCVEFVEWWGKVRGRSAGFTQLIRELSLLGGNQEYGEKQSSLLLGYAQILSPETIFWKFSIKPFPVKYSECLNISSLKKNNTEEFYSSIEIGRIYRSIRRNIYKKFIRQNRNYYNALLSLSRDETLNLRADRVNCAIISFVIWRMSIEGICNIEGLKFARKSTFSLRLMSPENTRIVFSEITKVKWCYFGFFGLWYKLNTELIKHQRISIDIFPYIPCDGFVYWYFEELKTNIENPANYTLKVIYPESPPFKQLKLPKFSKENYFVDTQHSNSLKNWSWAFNQNENIRILFKFTYSDVNYKSHFNHITV